MTIETRKPRTPQADRRDGDARRTAAPDRDAGGASSSEPIPETSRADSLIHVSLGEPPAARMDSVPEPDAGTPPLDLAALRERAPDIDLGERRRRPRPGRDAPFVAPEPLTDDAPWRRDLVEAEERLIDAADEQRFHEQSLAFERSDTDEETSELVASTLAMDRGIVYRDLSGHELTGTMDLLDEMDDDPHDLSAARATPGSYGLLARAYERLVGLFRKIPAWFGIRDERTGGGRR